MTEDAKRPVVAITASGSEAQAKAQIDELEGIGLPVGSHGIVALRARIQVGG